MPALEQDGELSILLFQGKASDLTRWANYGMNTDGDPMCRCLSIIDIRVTKTI